MKRGHAYAIHFAGGPAHVLVVSSDTFNEVYKAATCVLIYPQQIREPTIADIPVTTPSSGTVALTELRTLAAARFEDDLGPVNERVMEAVEVGLARPVRPVGRPRGARHRRDGHIPGRRAPRTDPRGIFRFAC